MKPGPLSGFRLWVTRPAGRGAASLAALREAGAQVIERPAIAFEPTGTGELAAARRLWDDPPGWHWLIFPSAAAVEVVARWPLPRSAGPEPVRLAAVGEASAAAVRAAFERPCLAGPGGEGAAGLLTQPDFAADTVAGRRILLVQGEGGRPLLEVTLRERGARVAVARVYRRMALPLDLNTWPEGWPHALTLSSSDLCAAVAEAVQASGRGAEAAILGVVAWSPRIAEAARAHGFKGPCECLPPSGEEGLTGACQRLWERL